MRFDCLPRSTIEIIWDERHRTTSLLADRLRSDGLRSIGSRLLLSLPLVCILLVRSTNLVNSIVLRVLFRYPASGTETLAIVVDEIVLSAGFLTGGASPVTVESRHDIDALLPLPAYHHDPKGVNHPKWSIAKGVNHSDPTSLREA